MANPYDVLYDAEPAKGNPYDDLFNRDTGSTVKQIVQTPAPAKAKVLNLGKETGWDAGLVERNQPDAEAEAKSRRIKSWAEQFPSLNPFLLSNPDAGSVLQDDLPLVGQIMESPLMKKRPTAGDFPITPERGFAQAGQELMKAQREHDAAVLRYMSTLAPEKEAPTTFGTLLASFPATNEALWGVARATTDLLSQYVGQPMAGTILPEDIFARMSKQFEGYAVQQGDLAKDLRGDRSQLGTGGQGYYSGIESLGQNFLLFPMSLATGSPTPALLGMSAATGGTEYNKAREKGLTPTQAITYAASQAAVEYATEKIPMTRLLGDLKAGTPFFQTLVRNVAAEVPGEQVATLVQDMNEWAALNPDKPFQAYIDERPNAAAQTLIATLVASGGQISIVKGVESAVNSAFGPNPAVVEQQRKAAQAQAAEGFANSMTQAGQQIAQTQAATQGPAGQDALAAALKEVDEGTEVIVDARLFTETLNQAGVDVAEVLRSMPTVADQYANAMAMQGDIAIPRHEYLARIATTPAFEPLSLHIRETEDALSLYEAQTFYQAQAEEMQRAVERVAEEKAQDVAWQESKKRVEDDLFQQMQSAGRFTADKNKADAMLASEMFAVWANRMAKTEQFAGMTPEDAYRMFALRVASERGAAGGQVMEQGKAEESIRAAFEALPSVSLGTAYPITVEFNGRKQQFMARQDALKGRNPRAALHLVHLKRGRMIAGAPEQWIAQEYKLDSKNNLKPNGMPKPLSDEEAAQFNANFPQPNPLATLAQAVKSLFTGAQQEQGGAQPTQAPTNPLDGLDMGQFFQGAQPAAYTADTIEVDGVMRPAVNSNGQRIAQTEEGLRAFYKWFGDSKVVDEQGRPLVVYHGTDKKFTKINLKKGAQGLFWFTSDKAAIEAGEVGAAGKGIIMELYAKIDAPANWKQYDQLLLDEFKSRGLDGALLPDSDGALVGFIIDKPTQIKSAIGNRGTFDPADPNILNQGQSDNRAEIAFGDITAQASVITLFEKADLSSFLHEMGHFQLEVLAHFAAQPNAPAEIKEDMDRVLKWFGVENAEVWRAMSLEEKRPYHEMFARGFEAYLFEGKAPTAELSGLFHRFRSWLISVYKSIKALNVQINDEIRGVFDRMIATDEAIAQAQEERGMLPLFPDDPAMVAEAEQATQDAQDELQRRSLRDMQWLTGARGRILKQLQREAKEKRKAVEAEVRAEVQAMPVYAAMRFLRTGTLTADQEEIKAEVHRLDKTALGEMYPESMLARPDVDGLKGLTRKDGLHPDLVAEMLSAAGYEFSSGDHLVREILAAEPEAQLIEGLTDQRVLERYGDIASPDALARAADEAIHNEARLRAVATELNALTKAQGPVRAMTKAAKDFAATMVARTKVRNIKPAQHAAAETRAAKAAHKATAAGDTTTAVNEKRKQLVEGFATRLSYDALGEVDKALRYLRKFDTEGTRKGLTPDYLDQIDQLLERYDLRKSTPLNAGEKRASLLTWLESQRDQGFEPDVPEALIAEAQRKPYKDLTLEEMRGLVDTVKQIEHLGRLKKKLLTAKDQREFQAIRDEIAASIEANAKGVRDLRTRNTTGAMLAEAGNRFLAMHRKMASVAREMDGFADGGPMWEYMIRSMNAAGDRETTMRADATRRLHDLLKPVLAGGAMGGKGTYFPTLGMSLNREERIAIALNLGNAGNMQRLLDGEGWTMDRLKPVLDTITPEEADFVQSVWDFFESYRPEIGAKERRIYGKEPEWVEPAPITLGGKALRGGYYPIKYDPARSGRAEQHADAEAARQQMRGAYTTATTRRSFTKARAEEVTGRPLLYSFAGVYQGTNEVIHDLAWHEWLIDANRLLRSLDGPIRLHYGAETVSVFKKAIEDIAAGDVPAQNVFERGVNHLRMGSTVAGLGWNFATSLLQPLGLTQSMVRVGPGWVAKGLTQWLKAPLETGDEVQVKSAFMADRARTMQREINEIQNQVRGSKLDPIRATFFLFIQKMQMVADMPTWLGAYEKAIAAGNGKDRAVALADQAVLDAQGGGQMKDLAQIQRGSPLQKLFTNFYSFFNVAYNLAVERTKEKAGTPRMYPSLALDYMLLFIVPSVMATLLKAALSGGDDDEEELTKKLIGDQISYLLGMMVGLREITAAVQKVAGVEQFKGSYGGPAGLRLFQEIDKLATQTAQGEADAAWLKAANNVGGNLFHYPSGQINKTVEGAAAILEGKTDNPLALLAGPPRD